MRSQVVFQCQRDDAAVLAHAFAPWLSVDDLMGLDAYEIAMRPSVGGRTIAPVTGTTLPLPTATRDAQALADVSRERYGTPRADVEAGLQARSQPPGVPAPRRGGQTNSTSAETLFGRQRKTERGPGDQP